MNTLVNATIFTAFGFLALALAYEFFRAVRGTWKFARKIRNQSILLPAPTPVAALPASVEVSIDLTREDVTEPVEALTENTTPELDSFPPISSPLGGSDNFDIPDFTSMTVRQLRDHCKAHKIKGYSKHETKAALAHFLEMDFIARSNRQNTVQLRDTLTPGSPEWQAVDNILATL